MYKIIGGDGQQYGPVNAEQLRQWHAERRVNGQTKLQAEGTAEWQPLATMPEFANLFAAPPPPVVPPITAAVRHPVSPSMAPVSRQHCGLAVTSMVLGILSLCCLGPVTGLPALVCGLVALNKINHSNGTLNGRGQALAGIITSIISVLMFFAWLMFFGTFAVRHRVRF
jgi:hypothetical protein